ncbi:Thermostable monoacylglycerol lipase [Pontiella desulfatans]|uniref:Thermostable monoacylglycerol lipase n=1 Tax=Pontiella desulfatans TaxID=2750659 RepID=A0A6C2UBC5_PONDE|nr:alpha/beta fold hydrolase [Pontiella desulfatans]VGO17472.1 Thermostable monoacylglycerol lipase [Pontiella desulfatans]
MQLRFLVAGLILFLAGCRSSQPARPGATERVLAHIAAASSGEQYKPCTRPGGSAAALLVHGVPGTPYKMKSISDALHAKGWTVKTVLLPGCGSDSENMYKRTTTDWQNEVRNAHAELAAEHDQVLVVALSMGCAVSCSSLNPQDLDGFVLIVPYQWIESTLDRMVWWLFGPLMPETWAPFKNKDFSDPEFLKDLGKVFPPETVADESLHDDLREFKVSMKMVAELRAMVRSAYGKQWNTAHPPTLIIQGDADEKSIPKRSRRLAKRMQATYVEVPGGHDLTTPDCPSLPKVIDAIGAFADGLQAD